MNTIYLKPHHLLDIIKLYGAGFKHFVPDENMVRLLSYRQLINEIIRDYKKKSRITIYEYCVLAKEILDAGHIKAVWKEPPIEETDKRIELLQK